MLSTRFLVAPIGALSLLGLIVPTAPAAAPAWSPSLPLTAPSLDRHDSSVTMAGDGTVVAVLASRGNQTLELTELRPGSTGWTAPVLVDSTGTPGVQVRGPVVVVDPTGVVTVVWLRAVPADDMGAVELALMAAQREPGASAFGLAEPLTAPASQLISGHTLVVSPSGRLDVAYIDPVADVVKVVTKDPGSPWGDPVPVPDSDDPTQMRARVDPVDGTLIVAWRAAGDPVDHLEVATRPPGAAFGGHQVFAEPDRSLLFPGLAVNPAGTAALVWLSAGPDGEDPRYQTAVRQSGGSFGEVIEVAPTGQDVFPPQVAVDNVGGIVVTWSEAGPVAAAGTAAGGFAPPLPLAGPDSATPVPVAGPGGDITLVWRSAPDLETSWLQAARKPAGGAIIPAPDVMTPVTDTEIGAQGVVVDANGDTVVVWEQTLPGPTPADADDEHQLRSSVLDVTAPTLSSVSVPATGIAQSGVLMAVTASDRWSPPATVAWSFGDGTSAAGTSTTHTYAAPGSYAVTVTATDTAGNATTTTRTVQVAAAPDTTAPVLTNARLKPKKLPTGVGAKLKLRSSEGAKLTGKVQRKKADGGWRTLGTRGWKIKPGPNDKRLYGTVSQKRLVTGSYRVVLLAVDAAGNKSAKVRLRFTVDRG